MIYLRKRNLTKSRKTDKTKEIHKRHKSHSGKTKVFPEAQTPSAQITAPIKLPPDNITNNDRDGCKEGKSENIVKDIPKNRENLTDQRDDVINHANHPTLCRS